MIPESELLKLRGIAKPDAWHTLKKGTTVFSFLTKKRRADARRALVGCGVRSVFITAPKKYGVPEGMYGLQVIWVQVNYLVDVKGEIDAMKPKTVDNPRDSQSKHTRGETPTIDFSNFCPFGYFKVTTNSVGVKRVVVHSSPPSIKEFAPDRIDEYKDYIKFLWEVGQINIDGVYFRPFEPDDEGYYHIKLRGGLRHDEEYDVPAEELRAEESALKADGYTRAITRKSEEVEGQPETWLPKDKMNSANPAAKPNRGKNGGKTLGGSSTRGTAVKQNPMKVYY